jgi:hypothetical protein
MTALYNHNSDRRMSDSFEDSTDFVGLINLSETDFLSPETDLQEMGFSDERNEGEPGVIIGFDGELGELMSSRASGYRKTVSDDAVGAFFKEMARYPLLKPDEEIELARRVKFLGEIEERTPTGASAVSQSGG